MRRILRSLLLRIWLIEYQIRTHIAIATFFYTKVPVIGRPIGMILDRTILIIYGIDMMSSSVQVKRLLLGHPTSVHLGGHGIYSEGRVRINAAVRMTAKKPGSDEYMELYNKNRVFVLGDNVSIGEAAIVLGPLTICDNVMIGAGSLVNKSITAPGVYVGNPLRKISDTCDERWVEEMVL